MAEDVDGAGNGADARSPLLEIRDLEVRRGGEALLEQVNLTVERGALHVLFGPNGAGKSTLLAAILGQIAFAGRIVARWRGDGLIGLVPQSFTVDRTLPVTVADFLALTRQRRPVCLGIAAATRRRVAELLAQVGLAGAEDKQLAVLSGGELRRVLLAHALDPSCCCSMSRQAASTSRRSSASSGCWPGCAATRG
jgi:zinc transport system ATP-binding protein